MPLNYKPSKYATMEWGPSLTEPEHESELTPAGIVKKLKAGLAPMPGLLQYGYEDTSMDYITRKRKLAQAKAEAEKSFIAFAKQLKDKKVKYKIPKSFEEFLSNQSEFKKFANEYLTEFGTTADTAAEQQITDQVLRTDKSNQNQNANQNQNQNQNQNANQKQNDQTVRE